jgi:hypothetical protein
MLFGKLSHLCPAFKADHFIILDEILWLESLLRRLRLYFRQFDFPRISPLHFTLSAEDLPKR